MNIKNEALQALSQGLLDADCRYVTNFPGFFSHDLFELLGGKNISINEKVAYEMAFGASLGGVRSVVTFKSFGLNVAADPFLNSLTTGVNAGLVLVLTEDVEVTGSQCRQDSRSYRDFFGGLWFEPTNIEEAYNIGYNSFMWSEQLDIPIVIRLTNQFFELQGNYNRKAKQTSSIKVANSCKKYVVHPINSQLQRENLRQKNLAIQSFIEDFYLTRKRPQFDKKDGCIVFGNCQNELIDYQDQDILTIITYPIPMNLIKKFIQLKENITILEQGNAHGSKLLQEGLLRNNTSMINIRLNTGIIPNHDAKYINWHKLEKLFLALKEFNPTFVVGDLSQFTNETTNTIQACLCLGASVPIGIGLCESGVHYPFCVSGDTSLIHAGFGVISETINRKLKLCIIIIDNGGSCSTGGQIPLSNLDLLRYIPGINLIEADYKNYTQEQFSKLFDELQKNLQNTVLRIFT